MMLYANSAESITRIKILKIKRPKVIQRNPKCSTKYPAAVGPIKQPRKKAPVQIPKVNYFACNFIKNKNTLDKIVNV